MREFQPPGEASCWLTLCSLQTDKDQLTAEAKELRQKVKYLQDQLNPLTRQREYQEKEIQRLNKVGTSALVPGRQRFRKPSCCAHPTTSAPDPQSGGVTLGQGTAAEASVPPRGSPPLPFPPYTLSGQPWAQPVLTPPPCPGLCCFLTRGHPAHCSGQQDLPGSHSGRPVLCTQSASHSSHFLAITYLTFCLFMRRRAVPVCTGDVPPVPGTVPGTKRVFRKPAGRRE